MLTRCRQGLRQALLQQHDAGLALQPVQQLGVAKGLGLHGRQAAGGRVAITQEEEGWWQWA